MERDPGGHVFLVVVFPLEQSVEVSGGQSDHISRLRSAYISEAGSMPGAGVCQALGKNVSFALCR
jgi:hypothetical protein